MTKRNTCTAVELMRTCAVIYIYVAAAIAASTLPLNCGLCALDAADPTPKRCVDRAGRLLSLIIDLCCHIVLG